MWTAKSHNFPNSFWWRYCCLFEGTCRRAVIAYWRGRGWWIVTRLFIVTNISKFAVLFSISNSIVLYFCSHRTTFTEWAVVSIVDFLKRKKHLCDGGHSPGSVRYSDSKQDIENVMTPYIGATSWDFKRWRKSHRSTSYHWRNMSTSF